MTVAILAANRIQDQQDFGSTPGAGNDGYSITWNNSTSRFVLTSVSGGAVSSVFGRTGAVTATTGDYTAAQVTNAAATNAANTFTAAQQVTIATTSAVGLTLKTSDNSTTNYLARFLSSTDVVLSRFTAGGVYQVADPDRPIGYAEFVADHAANDANFPRAAFYGYGENNPPANFGMYASSGQATGATQVTCLFGISTNKSVKQASSKQLIFYQSSTLATIGTLTAEESAGTPLSFSTQNISGSDNAIYINNNAAQSVMIGNAVAITAAKLYVKQGSATGNIPCLFLEQADSAAPAINSYHAEAVTNAIVNTAIWRHNSSGTPDTGFGIAHQFQLKSSTTADQNVGRLTWEWATATHASRTSLGKLSAYYTSTERECIRWEADSTAAKLGFLGATAVARQAHIADPSGGATVDAEARTAINSILNVLEAFGLVATS